MKTKKFKLRMNRRAVSPVIATLLLIAIAVAASVVTYTWVMSMTQNQSQQSQTSVKIDLVNFDSTTTADIEFRNTGSIAATIDVVYTFKGDALKDTDTADLVISAGTTDTYTITAHTTFAENSAYRIRAITSTGFVIEGTYYTPSSLS